MAPLQRSFVLCVGLAAPNIILELSKTYTEQGKNNNIKNKHSFQNVLEIVPIYLGPLQYTIDRTSLAWPKMTICSGLRPCGLHHCGTFHCHRGPRAGVRIGCAAIDSLVDSFWSVLITGLAWLPNFEIAVLAVEPSGASYVQP